MDLSFNERRSIDHQLKVHCNLYSSVISSLPLFQEHYQYLYKAMLSLVGSTDSEIFCSYMGRHGRILKTDKANPSESMESLVWRFRKTRRDEFIWQTFLEAFIFAWLVDKVKKKKSKDFLYTDEKFFWYLFLLLFVILLSVTTYSSTHLHTTKCSCLLCTILSVLLPDA